MKDRIAIIIPYFKGSDFLSALLLTIETSSIYSKIHSIYLINNSPGELADNERFLSNNKLKIIKAKPTIGFGRACNIGAKIAIQEKFDILFFINQDIRLKPDSLEIMHEVLLSQTSSYIVVTPVQWTYSFEKISDHFRSWILDKLDSSTENILSNQAIEITEFTAACFGLKSALIQKLGLFDPLFYMYGEDNDFYLRNQDKIKVLLCPSAAVGHWHSHQRDENYSKIHPWKRNSELVLRIRNDSGILGFLINSYAKAILNLNLRNLSKFIKHDLQLIFQCKALRNTSSENIKARIEKQVNKDLLDFQQMKETLDK